LVSLKDFFLRLPSTGAPFINIFRSGGDPLADKGVGTPVIIASDMFIARMRTRLHAPIKYRGYPSFLYISGLGSRKVLAQCFGRMNRVLIYRVPENYALDGLVEDEQGRKASVILCRLAHEATRHWEVMVNIINVRGLIKVYLNYLGCYITCEEVYSDKN
jgi:hypothetical protein